MRSFRIISTALLITLSFSLTLSSVFAQTPESLQDLAKTPSLETTANKNQDSKEKQEHSSEDLANENKQNSSQEQQDQKDDTVCLWVDDQGRPREEWHKDLVGGKPINLFKQCFPKTDQYNHALRKIVNEQKENRVKDNNHNENKSGNGNRDNSSSKKLQHSAKAKKSALKKHFYSPRFPHPGCKGIRNAYEKQENRGKNHIGYGLSKNYRNCVEYGTPYAGHSEDSGDSEDEANDLAALGSIVINNDDLTTETENVVLTLTPENIPETMQFSNDQTTWSTWEPFSTTKDWLLTDNSAGVKTVYVRYQTGNTVSDIESDKILLLPKYGAEYAVSSLPSTMETGRSYLVRFSIKNTGSLPWDSTDEQHPVQLLYEFQNGNQTLPEKGNYGLFSDIIEYSESGDITMFVRAPKTAGTFTLEFDLDHFGITRFSEMGVSMLSKQVTVVDKPLPERPTVDIEEMPFGVGGYVPLPEEPVPPVVTVCQSSQYLYSLDETQTMFTVKYAVPYGRSLHNVDSIWVDTNDNTAFYRLSYNEYVNDNEMLFLYRDSAVESEMCPEEQAQYPLARPCEELYPDVALVSNESCLDIAKASAERMISGYGDGTFKPFQNIVKAEFAKMLLAAKNIPLLPHPSDRVFNDIDPAGGAWWNDYAYTAYISGLMDIDGSGNFNPTSELTFTEILDLTFAAFDFDPNNGCSYNSIYSGNNVLGAAVFYGLIESNQIPTNADTALMSREYAVHVMVNAKAQANALGQNPPMCPNGQGPISAPLAEKEICGVSEAVMLSSSSSFNGDLGLLTNGTRVQLLNVQDQTAQVKVIATGQQGYVELADLADDCAVSTPLPPLHEPQGAEAVVSSPIGIYAHVFPNVTSAYVDVNGDGIGNTMDIIPYNSVLNVLEAKGNWLYVSFTATNGILKQGWIHHGFVALGPNVPVSQILSKKSGEIAWAHGITVDLRTEPNYQPSTIIWETYEGTTVQILEESESFYYVKIEAPSQSLSEDAVELSYGRLYPGVRSSQQILQAQEGISGWVHKEFVKVEGETYEQPFSYPFDYNPATSPNTLVTQIFLEEVFENPVHDGVDYALESDTPVLAALDGVVREVHLARSGDPKGLGNYVVLEHPGVSKYTIYGHLASVSVNVGENVTTGQHIGLSGGDGAFDEGSGKSHIHFVIRADRNATGGPEEAFNPTKWIGNYNRGDSNSCVRDLIINQGERDPNKILRMCPVGVGGSVVPACMLFKDTTLGEWYCPYLNTAYQEGWARGYPDKTFRPHQNVTRAEFAVMLSRAAGYSNTANGPFLNPFPDVNVNSWYGRDVAILKSLGIVSGYPDGKFHPEEPVKIEEAAKMIIETFYPDFDILNYKCFENMLASEYRNQWYSAYVGAAMYAGILESLNGVPKSPLSSEISRAQVVKMITVGKDNVDLYQQCPSCEVDRTKYGFRVISQVPLKTNPITFSAGETEKTLVVTLQNTGPTAWKKNCPVQFGMQPENYRSEIAHASWNGNKTFVSLPNDVPVGGIWTISFQIKNPGPEFYDEVHFGIYIDQSKAWIPQTDANQIIWEIGNPGSTRDFYYVVFNGWSQDGGTGFGGVYSSMNYNDSTKVDTLFVPTDAACANTPGYVSNYKPLVVQVLGTAKPYPSVDYAGKAQDMENMIKNYRTTRWYKIRYTKDGQTKTGYVPVSAVVLKDDSLFKIVDSASGCYLYAKPGMDVGTYGTNANSNIDKIMLHNTVSSSTPNLDIYSIGLNYFLPRTHQKDINSGFDNKFVSHVPEYASGSSTEGPDNGKIERQSIAVETINWSLLTPVLENKERTITDGIFHNYTFNDLDQFITIDTTDNKYNIVQHYYNGFQEEQTYNIAEFLNYYKEIPKEKKYELQDQYKIIVNKSNPDNAEKAQLEGLIQILNRIPFDYQFISELNQRLAVTEVVDVFGTINYKVWNHPENAEHLKNQRYYQPYTAEQYSALRKFINHMHEKYGIPQRAFEYDIPLYQGEVFEKQLGFYFKSTTDRQFTNKVAEYQGIISHRNQTSYGKGCPAPIFYIDKILNLNN